MYKLSSQYLQLNHIYLWYNEHKGKKYNSKSPVEKIRLQLSMQYLCNKSTSKTNWILLSVHEKKMRFFGQCI